MPLNNETNFRFIDGETALIFYYLKGNLNSYNALAGALEKYPDIKNIDVYFLSS